MVTPAQMFKNRLQEYAQKNSLPLPVYDTVNEGKDHLPQFKCTVTINGTKYESPPGFNNKKAAQHAAAKIAVEDLEMRGLLVEYKEKIRPKNVLAELASSRNMPSPTYRFTRTITATVQVNGVSYTGGPSKTHKEATNMAALEAILAIDPQYCNPLSHVELHSNNDSKQPTAECDASKFESKMSAENGTFDNQLLGGTEPNSAENPTSDNQLLGGTEPQPAENLTSDSQILGGTEPQPAENLTSDNQLLGGTEPQPAENLTSDNQLLGGTEPQPAENLTSDNQLLGGTEPQPAENLTSDNQLLGGTEPQPAENLTSDNRLLGGTESQPAENVTSGNQLLGGTESQSAENGVEKLNVDSAPALEKDSEKKDVENACAVGQGLENPMVKDRHEAEKGVSTINDAHSEPAEQTHNQPQQDSLLAQQGLLKKETGAVYEDKEHGSEEMQQISQELDLTESISKRNRNESENVEEMSQRKKKNRMETDGTADKA